MSFPKLSSALTAFLFAPMLFTMAAKTPLTLHLRSQPSGGEETETRVAEWDPNR